MISDATQGLCRGLRSPIMRFWTAGQREDPHTNDSPFIWRVAEDTQSAMNYTNWIEGKPTGFHQDSCMLMLSRSDYKWTNFPCSITLCAVCEVDISL